MSTPAFGIPPRYQETIDLKGRLSVRYEQNGKEEALHGSFVWSQGPAGTHVSLLSPLGQTIATILVTTESATLNQAGQAPRSAFDVDALTRETLGWPLPVAGLRDWLQGFANSVDGTRFVASPQANSVTTIDGWRIRYVSWQNQPEPRPRRIDMEHSQSGSATQPIGEVAIRIVIDNE